MKKVLALLLALVMCFGLVACTAEGEEATGLKILIVTSPSGVDDGSFNENNYDGIQAFIKANPGATVTAVQEKTGEATASVKAVEDVLADYDVIVTPGFQFAGIGDLAKANPEKKFILVDSYPTVAGAEEALDNVYAMQFAEQESGFFAGIAAAMETQTGKVAVMNGIAFPSNVNYQYGFESGVYYANKNLGTTAEIVELASYAGTDVNETNVGGNYVGDFNDEATGKTIAQSLIAEGCDIIFVAAGNSGNGAFTAAKETTGVKVIGCDVDQYDDGVNGDTNIVLTSGLKNMAQEVERQLNAIQAGTFKGGNNLLFATTDSTGYVKADGRHQLTAETIAALDAAYAEVKAGNIVPAANFNGILPESFQ